MSRHPDDWWASLPPARKAQVQGWLDPECGGEAVPVPGQIAAFHVEPKEVTPDERDTPRRRRPAAPRA